MAEFAINPKHNVFKKYRQVNYINSYVFTPVVTWNTFIGGVSGTISTAALLATKLGISVGAISNFTVVGSDIKCKITGSYAIPLQCFKLNTAITYYIDSDNLVTDLGNEAFDSVTQMTDLNFKGIITLTGVAVARTSSIIKVFLENCTSITLKAFSSSINLKTIYIPRVTSLGATSGNNLVFEIAGTNWAGSILYVPSSLQTSNGGGVEGDVTYFISNGGTARYVSNFTAPLTPTISSATGYKTYINLSISTTSTNAIDYYELYNSGVFVKNIPTSGFVDDLADLTSYNFSVIAVDIFYNKSSVSSTISTATTSTSLMPLTNLLRYFKLSDASGTTAVDKVGANNGTYVTMSLLQPAKVGYGIKGTAFTSLVNLNSNSIVGGKAAFSVSMWFKITSLVNPNYLYGSWNGAQNCVLIRLSGGNLQFFTYTTSQVGGSFIAFSDTTNWHHLVCTYDGAIMKMYLDGTVSGTTFSRTGTMNVGTATERIGDAQGSGSPNSFDETAIYSRALTAGEVTTIYNGGNGITL